MQKCQDNSVRDNKNQTSNITTSIVISTQSSSFIRRSSGGSGGETNIIDNNYSNSQRKQKRLVLINPNALVKERRRSYSKVCFCLSLFRKIITHVFVLTEICLPGFSNSSFVVVLNLLFIENRNPKIQYTCMFRRAVWRFGSLKLVRVEVTFKHYN